MRYIVIINLIISGLWCQNIERILVQQGQSFSFDCQHDESVLFGRRLNDWVQIEQDNEDNLVLDLNFNYLTNKNILRISTKAAQPKHVGYYTCRKSTWTNNPESIIYQIVLSDVRSFYWNYICHGPIGSCERLNELADENFSRFEIADQTNIELYCCASVIGYKTVNIHMNSVGDNFGHVEVNKKQERDGSWTVCAHQRTVIRRTSMSNQQILICELLTDNRPNSMLSSVIIIKDPILLDPLLNYKTYFEGNGNNDYFSGYRLSELKSNRQFKIGKRLAIIISSCFVSVILIGLIIFSMVFFCHRRKASNSNMSNSKSYSPIQTHVVPIRYKQQQSARETDDGYEKPTPLLHTTPVFIRC